MMIPETSVHGVGLMNMTKEDMESTVDGLEEMAKKGLLKPVLGEKYSFDEAERAHRETIEKTGCIGKKYFQLNCSKF